MDRRTSILLVAALVLLISMNASLVFGDNGKGDSGGSGNGNGNENGSGSGKPGDNKGDGKDNGNGIGNPGDNKGDGKDVKDPVVKDGDDEDYTEMPKKKTGEEQVKCKAKGHCENVTLSCPAECPERKPKDNKKHKGCYINCKSSKCECTCKYRKPNCEGYGSVCYDPRFIGRDGVMFYFHGAKGTNFALVSDDDLQINGHLIGTRPEGRTRDYTWVQALSVMFDSHTLVLAAKKVSQWNDNIDALTVHWDGQSIDLPTEGDAEWRVHVGKREVVVERTDDTNSVRVSVSGLVEMDVKVTPIGAEENKVHNYQLPSDDAFAHLETQFRFTKLTDLVEGVLGKKYRPDYVSLVKVEVPMPMMGGEDKYRTPSLLSPLCKACRFKALPSVTASIDEVAQF